HASHRRARVARGAATGGGRLTPKESGMYAFEYQRPVDLAQALAGAGDEARFLAGGQSLVQAMRLRLSSSERLVDLGAIDELRKIDADGDGVTIGAMATHAAVAASPEVRQAIPA